MKKREAYEKIKRVLERIETNPDDIEISNISLNIDDETTQIEIRHN